MALDQLDSIISELEAQLGLQPGQEVSAEALAAGATPAAGAPGPAAPANGKAAKGGKGAKDKGGTEKKQKSKGGKKSAPARDPNQPMITRLDIRVGQIEEVWHVEGSDKLFAEKINVGEEEPRLICSGLREFYDLEQMQGRRILVFCNLKPRKMGEYKSQGMVLCAEKEVDGKRCVEFVDPPEGAAVGERITYPSLEGEPWVPNQVQKHKVLEAVFPGLRADAQGVATWEGHPFTTAAGPCAAPTLRDCELH